MPSYKHTIRGNGDTILAEEWNRIGQKLESINLKYDEEAGRINSDLQVAGRFSSDKDLLVKGTSALAGDLAVGGALTVRGVSTFNSAIKIPSSKLGVGTSDPKGMVEIRQDVPGNIGASLSISNYGAGSGAAASIDFRTYDTNTGLSSSRIMAVDNGNYSNDLLFQTKDSGANTNSLINRLTIKSNGESEFSGPLTVRQKIVAGNSDIYFTNTEHSYTGIGNTQGYAAIENSRDINSLMILGRQTDGGKIIKAYDHLEVAGRLKVNDSLEVNNSITAKNSLTVNGFLGIGTANPKGSVEVRKDMSNQLGATMNISNYGGGGGAAAAIDFRTYDTGTSAASGRIVAVDNGNYSNDFLFQTKDSGSNNNKLNNRLIIRNNGDTEITGQLTVSSNLNLNGSLRVKNNPPTVFRRYLNLGDCINFRTEYSAQDYSAGIIGFRALGGDINENGAGDTIFIFMNIGSDGFWYIVADLRTHNKNENWYVDVLFIHNSLSIRSGY